MQSMSVRDVVSGLKAAGFKAERSRGSLNYYKSPKGEVIRVPGGHDSADASPAVVKRFLELTKVEEPEIEPTKKVKEEPVLQLHHYEANLPVRTSWATQNTFGSLNQQMAQAARRRAWAYDVVRKDPSLSLRKVGLEVQALDGAKSINPTSVMLFRHAAYAVIAPERLGPLTQKTLDSAGHLQLTKLEKTLIKEGKDLEPLLATSILDGYGRIMGLQAPRPEVVELCDPDELAAILRGEDHEIFDKLKELGVLDMPEPVEEEHEVSAFGPSPKEYAKLAQVEEETKAPAEFQEALQILFDTVWRTVPNAESCTINFIDKVVTMKLKEPEIPNFDDIRVEFE